MFRIRWPKSVSRKLLAAIAKGNSDLQTGILAAMGGIESSLRNEPEFVGESRGADERLLIVEPLSVVYKIDHRRRMVQIRRIRVHP
jgi:hypothetical protein